ncbi:BnaC02g30090D [Brassica napus]|uniref:BnaC02g30090D protein n=1 Tax=Brassica napus TaxID=3708 RepID=A0A078GKW1_BRANA|nr:BnaC02g30090D [Brassica napus]
MSKWSLCSARDGGSMAGSRAPNRARRRRAIDHFSAALGLMHVPMSELQEDTQRWRDLQIHHLHHIEGSNYRIAYGNESDYSLLLVGPIPPAK